MSVKILDFPRITDSRGSLTFLQNPQFIPFEIKRVFWLYKMPEKKKFAGHSFKKQDEVIIALNGNFDVIITKVDGSKDKISLNRSDRGLLVPSNTWRHIENFSDDAIGLILSNQKHNEEDYIRDFEIFKINNGQ